MRKHQHAAGLAQDLNDCDGHEGQGHRIALVHDLALVELHGVAVCNCLRHHLVKVRLSLLRHTQSDGVIIAPHSVLSPQ